MSQKHHDHRRNELRVTHDRPWNVYSRFSEIKGGVEWKVGHGISTCVCMRRVARLLEISLQFRFRACLSLWFHSKFLRRRVANCAWHMGGGSLLKDVGWNRRALCPPRRQVRCRFSVLLRNKLWRTVNFLYVEVNRVWARRPNYFPVKLETFDEISFHAGRFIPSSHSLTAPSSSTILSQARLLRPNRK